MESTIEELEKELWKLYLISNVDMKLDVDKDKSIVKVGSDTFYIKPDKLHYYLSLRLERAKVMYDMYEVRGDDDKLKELIIKNNSLTLHAVSCYRNKGDNNENN